MIFLFAMYPDRLLGPPIILCNGYWDSLLEVLRPGLEASHLPPSSLDVKNACLGRKVKTPASYSGGPGFKSQHSDRLSCLFRSFSHTLQMNAGIVP
jgi:hypothetical protein